MTRTCKDCPAAITRYSKGRCVPCEHRHAALTRSKARLDARESAATVTATTDSAVRTLAQLVRVCQIDTSEWMVDRWVANKWNGPDGAGLYQVKAWLVRRHAIAQAKSTVASLLRDAGKRMPRWAGKVVIAKTGYALELAIPDLHLGKLAWSKETGGQDYDSEIAERVYQDAVAALLARTDGIRFERIVLPIGNDFFNSDTKAGTTTSGTPLDNDSRWHKTFERGRRLLVKVVDRLRTIAPVEVFCIPGNHDALSSFTVAAVLEAWYRNTPDVTVHNAPMLRKYWRWGRSLVMWTHGHKGKKANYPLLMATERPRDFGATTFREVHTGHTHETKTIETHGIRVRTSPALCPPDAWHSENHFVGQQQAAEAYVWHKEHGLVMVAFYTVA